jgi:hypothetical protein
METVILCLHIVAELVAGFILCVSPLTFVPTASATHSESLRGVGNGALGIGFVGVALLTLQRNSRPRVFYGVIAIYHLGVVWLQLRDPMPKIPWWLPPGFHGLLAVWFVVRCLQKESKTKF